ncbi:ATP phosphoribosyltransferase [Chloroflexota bacterium]
MSIKIALPKGRLMAETAALLRKANWGVSGYDEKMRFYRLKSSRFPEVSARVFHEKDIPIQVALGNYDLGICGLDWVQELLVKYPSTALIKAKNLGYGKGALYIAASRSEGGSTLERIQARHEVVRIASEYPNLAEYFAVSSRMRRFSIFPLYGAAEVYPPENAELVLIPWVSEEELLGFDLAPLGKVVDFGAFLIANKASWKEKDFTEVLASIGDRLAGEKENPVSVVSRKRPEKVSRYVADVSPDTIRLALPDGHQQLHTVDLLRRAGIEIHDYPSATENRRPTTNLEDVAVKVIRPQDMPSQVANGNFDLAVTGRDWLREHLNQFPSSPVTELVDLKYGRVRIVAVVSNELSVTDVDSLRQFSMQRTVPLRIASEYINIADKYARDNHLGMYTVVPTWGASEACLPEDADLLIENTETGRTIARHNLKIIDMLFVSTGCLIGNKNSLASLSKGERIGSIIEMMRAVVGGA